MSWKEMLAGANAERTLERAKSRLEKNTDYVLGAGGFDPTEPLSKKCDCSGFVAWAIGIPRQIPPNTGKWLDTDTYWSGFGGLFYKVSKHNAQLGDLTVYPDKNGVQGHMGIISVVSNGPSKVIHCSKGNDVNYDDAIRETGPGIFLNGNHPTRIVRPDYDALRHKYGIDKEVREPRLILSRWQTKEGEASFVYEAVGSAEHRSGAFWVAPAAIASFLNESSTKEEKHPLREILEGWGLNAAAVSKHVKDVDDPRIYVYVFEEQPFMDV